MGNDLNEFLTERFGNHFWNQVIYHSIQNDEFLKKTATKIPIEVFGSREKKLIIKMIHDFYYEYKTAPKDNFYDLFKEAERTMSADLYNKCMNVISVLKEISGSNWEYIVNKIDEAIRHYRLEEASVEFASLIKNKKYDDAKMVILEAMRSREEEEADYFDYFTDQTYIEKRLSVQRYKMKTMIKGLDGLVGGFNPPWLITFLGTPKSGKSFLLLEMAVAGVLQGLNVFFVSLEMDKKVIEDRLDQIIGFMSSKEKEDIQEVMTYKKDYWVKSKTQTKTIYDIKEVERNRKKIRKIGGGNLKITAHHRARMNHFDIERLLDEAEHKEGFIPDLIIVDYLGIMKETNPGQSKKERISENCLGLKELCGKRKVIGITAMQGNRTAMTSKTFQPHMVADDIDTIHHCDMALAICQTPKEELENRYRLYLAIYRHGAQGQSIGVVKDLTIGQIALDTFAIKEAELGDEENKQGKGDYF